MPAEISLTELVLKPCPKFTALKKERSLFAAFPLVVTFLVSYKRGAQQGSDGPSSLKFAVDCGASFEKGQSIMGLAHREIVVDIKRTEKPHPAQSKP